MRVALKPNSLAPQQPLSTASNGFEKHHTFLSHGIIFTRLDKTGVMLLYKCIFLFIQKYPQKII